MVGGSNPSRSADTDVSVALPSDEVKMPTVLRKITLWEVQVNRKNNAKLRWFRTRQKAVSWMLEGARHGWFTFGNIENPHSIEVWEGDDGCWYSFNEEE